MTRQRTSWTPALLERLGELINQGLTYGEIAERMNVSREAARGAAQKHGLMLPSRRCHGVPWTRDEYDRLEAMVGQGMKFREIGEALGRNFNQVRSAVYRLNLTDTERRRHNMRSDWHLLDPIIARCIELELMSVVQIVDRLAALGHQVSRYAIHYHISHRMAPAIHRQLVANGHRRRQTKRLLHAQRRASRARQQTERHSA